MSRDDLTNTRVTLVSNTKINLGRFDNIEDAIAAYNNAALKHFNEFART